MLGFLYSQLQWFKHFFQNEPYFWHCYNRRSCSSSKFWFFYLIMNYFVSFSCLQLFLFLLAKISVEVSILNSLLESGQKQKICLCLNPFLLSFHKKLSTFIFFSTWYNPCQNFVCRCICLLSISLAFQKLSSCYFWYFPSLKVLYMVTCAALIASRAVKYLR